MRIRRLMLAGALVLAAAWAAAGERIERFLPQGTFLYGGVERLEEGYEKVMAGLARTFPDEKVFQGDRFLAMLADGLGIEGAGNREGFLARTGLDPAGPAGIAWVLTDPTTVPGRNLNENVLLILPLRDVAAVERLLAAKFLSEMPAMQAQACGSTLQRIQYAKDRLRRDRGMRDRVRRERGGEPAVDEDVEPGDAKELTWDDLAAANPGLKPLRCPGGGDYAIGAPGQRPTCSVHGQGDDRPRAPGPLNRQGLGVRTVGDVTLVGGRDKGVGYALTASHLIFSNNMLVLEDAVNAAAGKAPRADIATGPVGDADGRGYVNVGVLMQMLRGELSRAMRRRGPTPAADRLFALIGAAGGVSGDLRVGDDLRGTLSWAFRRNAESAKLLATRPTQLEAFALVPDTALAAWGTNLARETFSFLGDIMLMAEPDMAAPCKLVMAACDGDGAFALMPGALFGEVPNLLFILRERDREAAVAAAETWLTIFGHEFRPRGGDGGRRPTLRRHEVDGVEVWSVEGLRGGSALHYGFVGPFAVFGSRLEDLRAVIALHGGRAQNALVRSERYRKLGLPEGTASVISFVDMPALIGQIVHGEHRRRQEWQNRACQDNLRQLDQLVQQFRRRHKRLPENFTELRIRDEGRERGVRDWCMMFGQQTKLVLDPKTGRVSCPVHGTAEDFRLHFRDEPQRVPDEARVLSAFGLWALHIRVAGDRVVADGRLIPAPQRTPRPRPEPPRPPGPAEF